MDENICWAHQANFLSLSTILISHFTLSHRFHTSVLSIPLSYSVICNFVKTLSEIFYKVNKEGGKKSKSLRTSMEMGTFGAG